MDTPQHQVVELERRLKCRGVRLGDVLSEAQVDRSTWTRWKQGVMTPRLDSWMRVSEAAEKHLTNGRAA